MQPIRAVLLAVGLISFGCGQTESGPADGQGESRSDRPDSEASTPLRESTYGPEVGQAIYQDLVETTKRYHVFTDQTEENLGMAWEESLPRLEKEFSSVKNRSDVLRAVNHFANSLHNPHCYLKSPGRAPSLSPGFDIDVEQTANGVPRFYAAKVTDEGLQKQIEPGDELVSYQGVEAEDFLKTFHLESNRNHWPGIARAIARFFSAQSPHRHGTAEGDSAQWGFRSAKSGEVVTITAPWREPQGGRSFNEFAIEYGDPDSCAGLPKRSYGAGYSLAAVGANYCLYASSQGQGKSYPVVRQFSFSYSGRNGFSSLKADHLNIKKALSAMGHAKGVILDLRDNWGGNNPNWFLDWWAPGPYKSAYIYARLHEDFDTMDKLRKAGITGWSQPQFERYLKALAQKGPDKQFTEPYPFFCPTPDCEGFDNIHHPKNQVTKLPVAILTGPQCASSCDDVVHTFQEHGFGPVVGTARASGMTVARLEHKVRHPQSGEDLGTVTLAFSYEKSGKTGKRLEAVIVEPDYPVEPTFANRDRYDEILVGTAIKAFGSFSFLSAD